MVSTFQRDILRNPQPRKASFTDTAEQVPDFLHEEAEEIRDAYKARDVAGTIDGLVDLIYYAIGMADQMGVDLSPYFYEVHLANMEKVHDPNAVPGVNKRVIKPEGWREPRILEILEKQ